MIFNCLTLFPEMFAGFIGSSLCAKAIQREEIAINLYNFRDYTEDKHRRVDDYPFGGGPGMLIAPQPVFDCMADIRQRQEGLRVLSVLMSPAGKPLSQPLARTLSEYDALNILCGHYEGVDQRVIDGCIDLEVSIGDYILTGGELPAMVLMDCVMRYAGALQNEQAHEEESFEAGLLEYPQYTRPADYKGMQVPDVLTGGHHAKIVAWKREMALLKTLVQRPDLLLDAALSPEDRLFLKKLKNSLDFE